MFAISCLSQGSVGCVPGRSIVHHRANLNRPFAPKLGERESELMAEWVAPEPSHGRDPFWKRSDVWHPLCPSLAACRGAINSRDFGRPGAWYATRGTPCIDLPSSSGQLVSRKVPYCLFSLPGVAGRDCGLDEGWPCFFFLFLSSHLFFAAHVQRKYNKRPKDHLS